MTPSRRMAVARSRSPAAARRAASTSRLADAGASIDWTPRRALVRRRTSRPARSCRQQLPDGARVADLARADSNGERPPHPHGAGRPGGQPRPPTRTTCVAPSISVRGSGPSSTSCCSGWAPTATRRRSSRKRRCSRRSERLAAAVWVERPAHLARHADLSGAQSRSPRPHPGERRRQGGDARAGPRPVRHRQPAVPDSGHQSNRRPPHLPRRRSRRFAVVATVAGPMPSCPDALMPPCPRC